jgi:2'-hydroxyisoflavone reductase
MKILVIGGSRFVGYYMVEAALRSGHEVTMFNRGQSNPGIFPEVEEIHGDRDTDLHLLSGRQWDAVIDTCGYYPRIVGAAAAALKDSADIYCFISTISIYTLAGVDSLNEDSPVGTIDDETVEEITGETYGPLKVLCETVVEEHFNGRALMIRPGLIVGPRDTRVRLNYWIQRLYDGGDVLVPRDPEAITQIIDVRDLGDWTVRMVEGKKTGNYNAVGPREPMLFSHAIETMHRAIDSHAELTWVDADFLLEHDVMPWESLPLWIPSESNTMMKTSAEKAIANGLTYRGLDDTARSTLEWLQSQPDKESIDWRPEQMTAARESEIIHLWRESQQTK